MSTVRSQGASLRKPVAISDYFAIPLCIAQRLAGRSARPRCANDRLCNGAELRGQDRDPNWPWLIWISILSPTEP